MKTAIFRDHISNCIQSLIHPGVNAVWQTEALLGRCRRRGMPSTCCPWRKREEFIDHAWTQRCNLLSLSFRRDKPADSLEAELKSISLLAWYHCDGSKLVKHLNLISVLKVDIFCMFLYDANSLASLVSTTHGLVFIVHEVKFDHVWRA